jgi:hypothetical protein
MDPQGLYALLGSPPGASDAELRRAYRTALTKAHPDKPSGDTDRLGKVGELPCVDDGGSREQRSKDQHTSHCCLNPTQVQRRPAGLRGPQQPRQGVCCAVLASAGVAGRGPGHYYWAGPVQGWLQSACMGVALEAAQATCTHITAHMPYLA